MSQPEGQAALPRPLTVAALFAGLFLARLLAGHFIAFYQNDEISLADGAAALVRHSIGDLYHYGPQVGYYRLVQLLDLLLGGNIRALPYIMIVLSALAGTVIPLYALYLFPGLLTRTERWVMAGVLAINPIVWMSASYGNTTMPATALLAGAVTLLSRRPGPRGEAAALALFGFAMLVRADNVLASPLIALLLWQRHQSVDRVAKRVIPLVVALAAIYGILYLTDARMASAVSGVTDHLTNPYTTRFWDYLLWSTSPFLLVAAVVGVVQLMGLRRDLFYPVAAWCLPFFAFYYGSTTTPRYFVPTVIPIALCSAVGLVQLPALLAPARRRVVAWVVAAVAAAHLFVGLGWFSSGSLRNLLTQSEFDTQVGPMWTGALLYKSYFTPWFLGRSFRNPGFGRTTLTQHVLDSSLADVAAGSASGHTVVVLQEGWNGHVFHYYAHVHNARYVSSVPGPLLKSETWMDLGGARVMTIGRRVPAYRLMATLPVAAGDQVWGLSWDAASDSVLRTKLAPGLTLVARGDTTRAVRQYFVTQGAP